MNVTETEKPYCVVGGPTPSRADSPLSTGAELVRLKERLLQERLPEDAEPGIRRLARLEATEAEALSWLTSFPLLVFPVLLDEKLTGLHRYAARRRSVLRRQGSA